MVILVNTKIKYGDKNVLIKNNIRVSFTSKNILIYLFAKLKSKFDPKNLSNLLYNCDGFYKGKTCQNLHKEFLNIEIIQK